MQRSNYSRSLASSLLRIDLRGPCPEPSVSLNHIRISTGTEETTTFRTGSWTSQWLNLGRVAAATGFMNESLLTWDGRPKAELPISTRLRDQAWRGRPPRRISAFGNIEKRPIHKSLNRLLDGLKHCRSQLLKNFWNLSLTRAICVSKSARARPCKR